MSFATPATIIASSRSAFNSYLVDRASVERVVGGGVDDLGFPTDATKQVVEGLSSVPCRLSQKRRSSQMIVATGTTEVDYAELSVRFPHGTPIEIEDELLINGKVYHVMGVQDDVTNRMFVMAAVQRIRAETS